MKEEDVFAILLQQLEKMEEAQKVDISVADTLNDLIQKCKIDEQFWIKNEKMPIDASFLLYHCVRNSRLILEKMKQRFLSAYEKNENPHVIEDSIQVIPVLSEICEAISALKEKEPIISPEILSIISNRLKSLLKSLRTVAANASMLPSPEEELKGVDKRKIKRRFSRFADALQAMFIEV